MFFILKARPLAFFLFNDLLLITKRRLNGQFVCKDYAYRRFVVFEPLELNNLRVPPGVTSALGSGRNAHLLSCVLFQNARGRQVELLLSAENESDRERWLTAMRPPTVSFKKCQISIKDPLLYWITSLERTRQL